ncbi:MAG: iron-containing alcohol dehydrogenase [Oscillospiraceae bacterium]|nr:iron-containing alcohol dehydrogenase [Oscillospiraceae bacterium]
MGTISLTTKIYFGKGAVARLRDLGAKRIFLVTDAFFFQNGIAKEILHAVGGEGKIFHGVLPDPSVSLVAEGSKMAQEFAPDMLLALGGGSSMDCAKGILLSLPQRPVFVAVPTTSGTGSEVTAFSILTHEGVKHPLIDPTLRPDYAILDDDLLQNLPPKLIAEAGMDALTHCMEAVVSKEGDLYSQALAVTAAETLMELLPRSFDGDKSVRGNIHLAATLAGISFDHAGLGVLHAVIHALGGAFHIPHGRLGGVLLPHVMVLNEKVSLHQYARVARACGMEGAWEKTAVRNLRGAICRLRKHLGLPSTLREAGIESKELEERMEEIVSAAEQDACLLGNPRSVSREEMRKLLREAMG